VPVFRRPALHGSKYEQLEAFDSVHLWETDQELGGLLADEVGRRAAVGPMVSDRAARVAAHWDAVAQLVREGRRSPRTDVTRRLLSRSLTDSAAAGQNRDALETAGVRSGAVAAESQEPETNRVTSRPRCREDAHGPARPFGRAAWSRLSTPVRGVVGWARGRPGVE
jgi:hypothetical protein